MDLEEVYYEWIENKTKWWNKLNVLLVVVGYSVLMFGGLLFLKFMGYIIISLVLGFSIYIAIQQYWYKRNLELIINKEIEEKEKDDEIRKGDK